MAFNKTRGAFASTILFSALIFVAVSPAGAATATFDFGKIAEGETFGSIDNPEVTGTSNKAEGDWNTVVPLLNDGGLGDTKLVINGIGVTAYGYKTDTLGNLVETDAFLDSKSSGKYGGLGVCSTVETCTTGSSLRPINTADDNVTSGESLKLIFDTNVTYDLTQLTFRNADHNLLTGGLEIAGTIVSVTSGLLNAASIAALGTLLTNTTETIFKYTSHQFYLTAATVFNSSSINPVPLPAGVWLLLSALGGLGLTSWRRRRTTA